MPVKAVRAHATGTGRVEPANIHNADALAVLSVAHAGVAAERIGLGENSARLHADSDDGILAAVISVGVCSAYRSAGMPFPSWQHPPKRTFRCGEPALHPYGRAPHQLP